MREIGALKKANLLIQHYATHGVVALMAVMGITGTMMFYRFNKGSVQNMHAWVGMAALLAVGLHLTRNRRQLTAIFSHTRMHVLWAVTAAVVMAFLYAAPAPKPNFAKNLTQAALRTPLINLVPVLGIGPELILDRMRAAGVTSPVLDESIAEAAERSLADPMTLLGVVMQNVKKSKANVLE
jgi:hypothetical protein